MIAKTKEGKESHDLDLTFASRESNLKLVVSSDAHFYKYNMNNVV
jgi:hypothetical protein